MRRSRSKAGRLSRCIRREWVLSSYKMSSNWSNCTACFRKHKECSSGGCVTRGRTKKKKSRKVQADRRRPQSSSHLDVLINALWICFHLGETMFQDSECFPVGAEAACEMASQPSFIPRTASFITMHSPTRIACVSKSGYPIIFQTYRLPLI